ncbi:uncharacterized protein MONOS_6926 [Monocercomonoides exilis]|uniref:uncharacterized protein n=1 Tax=Monocercomonoides exilis TaxID=2049356 RepID=UPI003559488C|nr:hypothetical protein MONOS_6926 [Monocercomonoides exilis]|eukprot:MONOS_6926.1-p1 / transcript=MONOS_6926.1 / gene=MONOS_6926 / organism=Monocercomonoides_exilis_PA203 / gene_product=unspecified product / transcript_product=unspecified product / location=Mono_scaffold00227:37525-37943(-) / protein_length=117 / sequence_SO=supercontig / SO=protein_coding / is_pseudo=false
MLKVHGAEEEQRKEKEEAKEEEEEDDDDGDEKNEKHEKVNQEMEKKCLESHLKLQEIMEDERILKQTKRAGGAVEGEGIDHPDVKEKDSGDEREEQCRDKGAAGADRGDEEEDGAY